MHWRMSDGSRACDALADDAEQGAEEGLDEEGSEAGWQENFRLEYVVQAAEPGHAGGIALHPTQCPPSDALHLTCGPCVLGPGATRQLGAKADRPCGGAATVAIARNCNAKAPSP